MDQRPSFAEYCKIRSCLCKLHSKWTEGESKTFTYEFRIFIFYWITYYLLSFQFLLVTGGWSSFYSAISDETEIFTESQASWRTLSARLPVPVYVPKAVSIDNKVLLFGKDNALIKDFGYGFRNYILFSRW